MAFRIPGIVLSITFGMLFTSSVASQEKIGDWELRVQDEESETRGRVAFTFASVHSDSKRRIPAVTGNLRDLLVQRCGAQLQF